MPDYLISIVATPSNFFLMASASSLDAFSLSGLGAPSTRSLASLRPSEVTSRTALMVLILFAPKSLRMTWNSVFSGSGAAAAPPPPAATATGAAAAAETPRRSSSFFTRAAASSRLRDTICSSNCAKSAIFFSIQNRFDPNLPRQICLHCCSRPASQVESFRCARPAHFQPVSQPNPVPQPLGYLEPLGAPSSRRLCLCRQG